MNKICTSLEQSQKLIELGIDVNTSDMFYADLLVDGNHKYNLHPLESYCFNTFEETKLRTSKNLSFIPAWSLSALLSLIPDKEEWVWSLCKGGYNGKGEYDADYFISFETFGDEIGDGGIFHCESTPNKVDAVFEMVVWLKENKYI